MMLKRKTGYPLIFSKESKPPHTENIWGKIASLPNTSIVLFLSLLTPQHYNIIDVVLTFINNLEMI